jgi:hypothetical protein
MNKSFSALAQREKVIDRCKSWKIGTNQKKKSFGYETP